MWILHFLWLLSSTTTQHFLGQITLEEKLKDEQHVVYTHYLCNQYFFQTCWALIWGDLNFLMKADSIQKAYTKQPQKGASRREKKLSYRGFFPIETCRVVIAQADVIVVVEVEQQHTMWQVEWQWPRESAFSHPDPPVTPSSCPRSWDAWREKSAPTSLTRSTPTHSSCSKSELAPEQSRVIVRQASSAEWMWHRVANSGGRELLNYGIFYRQ